jgi:hypothetical protein
MCRRRFALLVIAGSLLPFSGQHAAACPIPVESIWETIDRAAWFGVLHTRCAPVPVPEEVRAAWFAPDEEITFEPPESFVQVVEWKPIRTISGAEEKLPSAADSGWGCDAEGWQEPSIVAFETDGGTILTSLSMSGASGTALDAQLDWVREALELKRIRGERVNEGHRLEWVVDGIVDPRTRGVALQELIAAGWWPSEAPEETVSPLGAPEKDRILRAFVREPDVVKTLPQMLWLLRDQPSLVGDLAAVDAMDSELARLERESDRVTVWGARWAMKLVLERLGVAEASDRVRVATSAEGEQEVRALRGLWREVRCETGYASRAECEPDPSSAQSDAPKP